MAKLLKFGGTHGEKPDSVILALKGGNPQSLEYRWWSDRIITNFRKMSGLEHLATPGTGETVIGKEVARFANLHEWVKASTMRFLSGDSQKIVYVDSTGAVVHFTDIDESKRHKAKFPVMAHEAEYSGSGGRVVLMPDIALPLYSDEAVATVHDMLAPYEGAKRYCFAFSKNASAIVETVSKHYSFDGLCLWSGVNAPTERDNTPRKPTKVVVVYGEQEKCKRNRRGCKDTAEDIAKAFTDVGSDVTVWSHNKPGSWLIRGHTWDASLNNAIALNLEIP